MPCESNEFVLKALERLEGKFDRLLEAQIAMGRTLDKQEANLATHVMRTNLLQEEVSLLKDIIEAHKEEAEAEMERLEAVVDEVEGKFDRKIEVLFDDRKKSLWSASWHANMLKWGWKVVALLLALGGAGLFGSKIDLLEILKALVGAS